MNRQQVLPHVLADMEQRIKRGAKEYGEPLTTHNGRDALQDAYEEALDMCLYLKQAMLERAQAAWNGPDWASAPSWARCWALSSLPAEGGCGMWLTAEPVEGETAWERPIGGSIQFKRCDTFGYPGHWRDSLRRRPGV